MPNSVSLTDGTTTIALSSDGCFLINYVPTAPDMDKDGNYRQVTETVEFFIIDSSAANVQAKIASIERLLQDAVRAQAGLGGLVYLTFQTGADVAAVRSEIVSSRLLLGEDASVNLYQNRMDCRLIVTRLHYWEGAEVEVQLSTSNQAAATGGRTIYNHDDGGAGHDNWVQIAAAQVSGSLPASTRVQVANASGSARTYTRMFIAHNALSDPANFAHIVEAEDRLSGGTITVNAAASNGNHVAFTLAGTSLTMRWDLGATLMNKAAGKLFRVLAVLNGASGSGTAQVTVQNYAGTVVLWKGDVVPMLDAVGILDLGAIPLPPGGYSTSYGQFDLAVTFKGTGTWSFDFLQLTPTDGLGLVSCTYNIASGEHVVLDSILRRDYSLLSGAQYPHVVASGGRIELYPNRLQRIYVLAQSTEAGVVAGDTFSVRVYCRPRRLTV